jgi:hypothetical protein
MSSTSVLTVAMNMAVVILLAAALLYSIAMLRNHEMVTSRGWNIALLVVSILTLTTVLIAENV